MDASGTEQQCDDWDDFSDSELLDFLCEIESIDSQRAPDSQVNAEPSVYFESPSVSSTSMQNCTEAASRRETVQSDELRGLKRKSLHKDSISPMQHFLKRHLSVSLLCDQSWCEMKTVYSLLKPHVKRNDMQRAEVQMGKDIHLSRELEIQNVVPVDISTREEGEAIKLLNMLHMTQLLGAGECVREFPVFGVLEGVFIMGVIDELRYNLKGELVLNELKTRKHNSMPCSAQDKVNCFQADLYKLLFDGLVRGEVKKEHILFHLKLRSHQVLGAGVRAHAKNIGVHVVTFEDVLDAFLVTMSCSDLPCIDLLQLEYHHQGSRGPIGTRVTHFDEAQLREDLKGYLAYWRGEREPKGVDIEEAWKCRSCLYKQTCSWTKNRSPMADQNVAGGSRNLN
ncbi:exonuclease V isoform X1 [Triplophysa dalaica]|uniref:exonuclease V isoform X1 n=1 Tax=Triplophysa dalaica TaxID=1582913 RepID=UPI0024DF52E5|nr:exonuclease V isoform X1 [Triplophysa dalaica]